MTYTVLSPLYLKMCRVRLCLLKIGNEVFHCQFGFAHHRAPGALDKPVMAFFGACDSLRSRIRGRLWHAGEQGLRETVEVREQRLLRARYAEYILSHLV